MNCKEVQRQLVPYINGELQEKTEEEFVRHVRHCSECYEELEVYATERMRRSITVPWLRIRWKIPKRTPGTNGSWPCIPFC